MKDRWMMRFFFLAIVWPLGLCGDDTWRREWHVEGLKKPLKIELVEAWGGLAYVSSGSRLGHFPISRFPPDEQAMIKKFKEKQMAARGGLWAESRTAFWKKLEPRLFALKDGKKTAFKSPEGKLEPDFYVFYFGASWCGPCHRFMPKLLSWYDHWKGMGFDNFEVIFVSWDETTSEQIKYYERFEMPFHLLKLGADKSIRELSKIRPPGIPSLLVFDRDGNPLYHTYDGSDYRGASAVIEDIKNLLLWSNAEKPIAISLQFTKYRDAVQKQQPWGPDASPKLYHGGFSPELIELLADKLPTEIVVKIQTNGKAILLQSDLPTEFEDRVKKELDTWYFLPAMEGGHYVDREVRFPLRRSS